MIYMKCLLEAFRHGRQFPISIPSNYDWR